MDEHDSDAEWDRRRFIRTVGASAATATAMGAAGCQEVNSYEFTAALVGLSEEGVQAMGFAQPAHEVLVDERTQEVSGQSVDLTVESHAVSYQHPKAQQDGVVLDGDWNEADPTARALGVLATPEASVLGQKLNPVATEPLSELVAGPRGRDFLRRTGVGGEGGIQYRRPPERVAAREGASVLGETTTVETYAGIVAGDDGPDEAFLAHLSRVTVDGDAILLGTVQRRAVPESFDGERIVADDGLLTKKDLSERIEFAFEIPPYLTLDPPIEIVLPTVSLTDVELVQKVADTYVDGVGYTEPDPDIVAGENTAVVFDLEGSNLDRLSGDVRFDLGWKSRGHTAVSETFYMSAADVTGIVEDRYETLAVLHINDNTDNGYLVPTFRMAADNEEVSLTVGAGGSAAGDTVTLTEGIDYDVRTVEPLRIAFVEISDPDDGDNFGDGAGRASNYDASVDYAADYLPRVYPGNVSVWRFDFPVEAGGASDDFGTDLFDANSTVESLLAVANTYGSSIVTGLGSFLVTPPGRSVSDEVSYVLANGFDVVSAIVPGNYGSTSGSDFYGFHGRNFLGFAPWSSQFAVSTLEYSPGGTNGMRADKFVETVAQETLHQLVGDGPYQDPTPNHPMGQRRATTAGGVNTTVGTNGVDYAHARDPVRSTAFDLSSGDFFVVEGFDYSAGPFDPDGPTTKTAVDDVQSLMSYTPPDTWTDARLHQALIDLAAPNAGSGGGGAVTPTSVLAVSGRVFDEGGFAFDLVRSYDGIPRPPREDSEKEGDVLVSFLGPNGQTLDAYRVPDTIESTHGHPIEGIVSFVLPFSGSTAFVHAEGRSGETILNPITASVTDAVDRVPERGFVEDPRAVRKEVVTALLDVDERMREGEFDLANDVMRKEVRARLDEQLRQQYERALNQPSRRQVLDLVDEMVDRLAGLAQMAG